MGGSISSIVFQPPVASYTRDMHRLITIESMSARSLFSFSQSQLSHIPILVHRPQSHPPLFYILYTHGNAEDIGQTAPLMQTLANELQCVVVSYDYAGYGIARDRESSEENCYSDINTVYEWIIENNVDPRKVILMGRSLGSGATVHLASKLCSPATRSRYPPAGVILQSPIASVLKVASTTLSIVAKPLDMFTNADKVCSTCCVHSHLATNATHDDRFPILQFRFSFAMVLRTRWFLSNIP